MRRAQFIAARLLEAGTGELPQEAPRGMVYVFRREEGRAYANMDALPEPTEDMIQRGAVIILAHDPDHITVYSKAIPVPMGTADVLDMMDALNVLAGANVGWARSPSVRPAAVDWRRIFASQKYMDQAGKESERMQKEIERDQEKEQKAQEQGAPKGSPAVQVVMGQAQRVPVPTQRRDFDMGVNGVEREGQKGVEVVHVYRDTPAARSNLERGDIIITVGPYLMNNGQKGHWTVDTDAELRATLGWLMPGHPFKMQVVRGGQAHDVVLMPDDKSDWDEPATLARRSWRLLMPDDKSDWDEPSAAPTPHRRTNEPAQHTPQAPEEEFPSHLL